MSELPQLDPMKLYKKAMAQISSLTEQGLQMDEMIELLITERDAAIQERDKAQQQLQSLTDSLGKRDEGSDPLLEGELVE